MGGKPEDPEPRSPNLERNAKTTQGMANNKNDGVQPAWHGLFVGVEQGVCSVAERCSAARGNTLHPQILPVVGAVNPMSRSHVDIDPCSFLAVAIEIGEQPVIVKSAEL